MEGPRVRFAIAPDGVRIAYAAWGSGPTTVLIPPIVSNVELAWENDRYRRVLEHLGGNLRVIAFDKRGIGLSDRFSDPPTAESRLTDIAAVMDAEGVHRAHLIGISEGAVMGMLFAARFPERVDRLVVANGLAPRSAFGRVAQLASPGALSSQEILERWRRVIDVWGDDPRGTLSWIAPSTLDDDSYVEWQARFERLSATRDAIRRQLQSLVELDVGDEPRSIAVPTLVTHTVGDRVVDVGHSRTLAEMIPGAQLVEFEGDDHFFPLAGYWRMIVDRHIEFLTGSPVDEPVRRSFAAVLFTDIVGSTATGVSVGDAEWRSVLDRHDRLVAEAVDRHHGRIVTSTGDGVLALFESPSSAIVAAIDMRNALAEIGIDLRAGIHAGEVERRGDNVSGYAVNLAARVEAAAESGDVLVTSTVRDLLRGSSHRFEAAGEHRFKGFDDAWSVFRAT